MRYDQLNHPVFEAVCVLGEKMIDAVPRPALLLGEACRVLAVNRSFYERFEIVGKRLVGLPLGALEGRGWSMPGLEERLEQPVQDRSAFRSFEIDCNLSAAGRRRLLFHARQIYLEDIAARMTLLTVEGNTPIHGSDDLLVGQREKVRTLASELALAEERRRRGLAVALHDNISQSLVLIKRRLAGIRDGTQGAAATVVGGCIELLDDAVGQVRDLMFDLSPPVLYDLGLIPALEWLADRMRVRFDLKVSVVDDGRAKPMSRMCEIIAFRSIRELMMNAVKYASDGEVVVTVGRWGDVARFVVRDEGPGFEAAYIEIRPDGGFGLASVREQIGSVGGEMEIQSVLGEGTRVTLLVPLCDDQQSSTPGVTANATTDDADAR